MKQILLFRRLFAAVLLLAVSTLSWAYHDYTFKANEIWYGVNTKRPGAEVIYDSSYNSWTSVVIPSFVTDPYTGEQRSVIGIDGAFKDCKDLTYVSIPNTVTTINGTFYGCTGLTSITIPSSVTCIGEKAFYECAGLTSITIPSSVTSIEREAFMGCTGLTSISIGNSVTTIGNQAFESCTSLTSITIPDSLTTIGYGTFWGCSALTSVSVPESVTNIGEQAFSYCSGLTSIIIPNSVTSIGNSAFDACTGLTSVSIPESVTSIGSQAFAACTSLISVDIPNSVSSIGERAFMDCSALTSVTIPNSITSIESYTFEGCTSLKSVTIPENVTSICYQAFGGCSSLKEVYCMAEQVPDTHYSTVFEKSSIKSATLYVPKSSLDLYKSKEPWKYFGTILPIESDVETSYNITATANPANGGSITGTGTYQDGSTVTLTATPAEGYEFENWTANGVEVSTQATYTFTATQDRTLVANFHETDEGNRINGIYYNFDTETNTAAVTSGELKYTGDIVIPETVIYQGNTYAVTSIANSAFRECTDLTSVTIGNSVTTIGYAAFRSCSKLTSITIPNSVISIGDRAFYDCSSLTTITIPNSVTSIGGWAFFDTVWYDNQPNGMVYAGKVAYVYKGAMPSETHITLDEGTLGIAGYAFNNCSGLTSVTIPNSVICIGDGAFAYCSNLNSVTCYAEKVPSTGIICFTSVPQSSATLYVPSSSVNAYKSAFQWSSFGTILPIEDGETSYNITATANPSSGGSITGVGAYQDGATVTMTATPASGYEFIKWTENGTAVSTQATYIFTATQDRTLVANFKKVDEGNNVISDVSQLSNDKCYYLYTKDKLRGGLGVNTDYGSIASTFSVTNAKYKTGSVTPFLVFYYNDNFYLYSVEANAFVTYSGGLTRTNITEENAVNITRNSNGYFMISFVATRRVLNINTNPGLAINNWGTSVEEYDEGNQFTIEVAGDFDSSVIVDLINEPNTTSDEDIEHYAQTPVQGMNELVNAQVYTAVTRRAAWYVPASGTRLESTVRPIAERWHCSDAGQQFAFIQHNGQYYIYSVGEKKILNGITNNSPNKGMLVTEDCQPVNIMPTHDTQYPLYFSFGESYNVNIDDSGMVTIDSWTTMDDGNKVALRPVQDVMLSEADIKRIIGYIKGFIPGDVNGDGDVNGADIVAVINYVLNDSKTYGDVNGDGEVNGADIVSTINYVLSYTSDASRQQTFYAHRAPERQADTCDCLSGNIDANGFSIGLTNEIDFTAFQFMLQLPDGCELTNISADASRLDSHALQYRRIADGRYLVLGYNMENEKITGEDGTLLHLQLAGNMCESASVTDVLFFTPKAKTYCLAGLHIDLVTGLTSLDNATEDVTGNVYDVYGRIVMTAGQYAKQKNLLPEGIYIRNGRKFIVK